MTYNIRVTITEYCLDLTSIMKDFLFFEPLLEKFLFPKFPTAETQT